MDERAVETSDEPGDFELMRRVREGDREAFEVLIRRHQQGLMNFFARMGAYTDAEDLAQKTLLKVFEYRFRYRETAKFTTFLYTLARHAWIDGLRRKKRRDAYTDGLRQDECLADTASAGRAAVSMDAQAALEALPQRLRSVVVLGICQGLAYEDVARILKIPTGTVKSRMFVALRRMREFFDEDLASRG